jgi:hypothetical protein
MSFFLRSAAALNAGLSFIVAIFPDPARWFSLQLGLCLFATLLARPLRRQPQLHSRVWFAACVFSALSLTLPDSLDQAHALFNTALWWLLVLISWPPGGGRRRRALERIKNQLRQWSRGMPLPG